MRILITGAAGMLGRDVASAALAAGHEAIPLTHAELDITDPQAVDSVVARARPDVVINCAAWTDVDLAERSIEQACEVNAVGAGYLARAATESGAWTLHISSDYVFDGSKREPYVESDAVGPLSAYGRSKLAGELAVAQAAPESHTVVRSSWLFGSGGPCFPATILRLAAERDELSVVDDQVGCPTYTGHLGRALVELAADHGSADILHLAADGECSWYELAREIIEIARLPCEVRPEKSANLDRPAPRPAYSVLRTERGELVAPLPDWRVGLAEFMSLRVAAR